MSGDDNTMKAEGDEPDVIDAGAVTTNSPSERKQDKDAMHSGSDNGEQTNAIEEENQRDGEGESESDASSNEDSEEDDDDDNLRGMSAIERRRQRNIERNQAALAELGLHSKDDSGFLGKKRNTSQRRRRSVGSDAANLEPKRRSKRSEGKSISYVEPSLRNLLETDQPKQHKAESIEKLATRKRGRSAKESSRMARFVYDEFQTIATHKRRMIKEAEKNLRSAETELKYWQKKAAIEEKRAARELELEQIRKNAEEEIKVYGMSSKDFLQKLDARTAEIATKIRIYDSQRATKEQQVETTARQLENEAKFKLLNAICEYPKAMKDAIRTLNSCLLERAPKDPPPPRRSKRKGEDEDPDPSENAPKKRKSTLSDGQEDNKRLSSESSAILNAATQASLSQTESGLATSKLTEEETSRPDDDGRTKKKRELNVGGWISPSFSPAVRRSWLENDQASKRFQLCSYVPQVGDTVLYFISGHRDFVNKFPDHLAKNRISRAPLWERVEKERRRVKLVSEGNERDTSESGEAATASSSKRWWNDEWLSLSQSGKYPIVCRVEKTQAEFPPDPNKVVKDSNTNTWTETCNPKAKPNKHPVLRLAVTLRPLTPLLPPSLSSSGLVDRQPLSLPPNFTVVTFPSKGAAPFLIPFTWAYIRNQLVSVDDSVLMQDSDVERRGRIVSFARLEGDFGSFRLDDMKSHFARALQLSVDNGGNTANALPDVARGKQLSMIPPQDAVVLREFLSKVLDVTSNVDENDLTQSIDFLNLIRSTLPLWGGICTVKDVYDRRTSWVHPWDLKFLTGSRRNQGFTHGPLQRFLDVGLPRTLDNMLRLKLECTLEDFLSEGNPEAAIFRHQVSEEIAPGYGCAVPLTLSFERILKRLKSRGTGEDEAVCYYRCFESIASDLNAIQDNCCLYNDPKSAVVQSANRVIPAVKKLLEGVVSTHIREQREKLAAENEKKKFLASVLAPDAGLDDEKDAQKMLSKARDPFLVPFRGELYRDWLQCVSPGLVCPENLQSRRLCLHQYTPQPGDSVLYSRELHVKFVEGHFDVLDANQRQIPQIICSNDAASLSATSNSETMGERTKATTLTNGQSSAWLTASIVSMRAEFPRARKAPSKPDTGPESRFTTDAPILAIGLQIRGQGVGEGDGVVAIYWRPCIFLGRDKGWEEKITGCCPSCGNQFATSFMCPTWGDQFGRRLEIKVLDSLTVFAGKPPRIHFEEADAIVRGLDLLKRRCLEQVLPDHLDPNLTTDNVKDGYIPRVTKFGNRPLPTFDLGVVGDSSEGVLSNVPHKETSALLTCNFLPPWMAIEDAQATKKSAVGALEAAISPCPKMSLELVILRLKHDFYRHKAAITSDIIEAYVTSVLLCLTTAAKRKKNPISIKKLAAVLASRKYASAAKVETASDIGGTENVKKKTKTPPNAISMSTPAKATGEKEAPTDPQKSATRAKIDPKTVGKSKMKKVPVLIKSTGQHNANCLQGEQTEEMQQHGLAGPKSRKILNEEETALIVWLERVRRLYAAALVCVSEVHNATYLFGCASLKVSRTKLRQHMIACSHEDVHAAKARKFLLALLDSLKKDACDNRFPFLSQSRPQMKVKFTVGGKPVEREANVANPAVPVSVSSLSLPEAPKSHHTGPVSVSSLSQPEAPKSQPTETTTQTVPAVASKSAESHEHQFSCVQSTLANIGLQPESEWSVARDGVPFHLGDCDSDLPLSRLFYGKEKRMNSCVRCQVSKKSMVFCRVIRGHSNADFDLLECLRDAGGVDGLLRTMFKEPSLTPLAGAGSLPRTSQMLETANADRAQANASIGPAPPSAEDTSSCENQDGSRAVELDKDDEDGTGHNDAIAPGEKKTEKEASIETKDEHDARDLYRKAQAYHALAEELVSSAKVYKDAPPRLSQDFMDEFFPVDPSDGKYTLCVVCGLDGELICCETPTCPTVVHVKCTTMSEAPEGDWLCDECVIKKTGYREQNEGSRKASLTWGYGDLNCSYKNEKHESPFVAVAKCSSSAVVGAQDREETSLACDGPEERSQTDTINDDQIVAPVKSSDDTKVATPSLTMRPVVTFDESKHRELSAGLGQLFFIRTGHRRGLKSEEMSDGRKRKPQIQVVMHDERTKEEESRKDEEYDVVVPELDLRTIPLGTVFYKKFKGHGTFEGKVTQLPNEDHQFYRVRYEDDDEEDMTESQLLRLLHNRKPKKSPSSTLKIEADIDLASSNKNEKHPAQIAPVETTEKRNRGRQRKRSFEDVSAQRLQEGTTVKRRGRPRKLPLEDISSSNALFMAKPVPEQSNASDAGSIPTKPLQSPTMNGKSMAKADRVVSTPSGNASLKRNGNGHLSHDDIVENQEASDQNGKRSRRQPDRFVDKFAT